MIDDNSSTDTAPQFKKQSVSPSSIQTLTYPLIKEKQTTLQKPDHKCMKLQKGGVILHHANTSVCESEQNQALHAE